eukprot:4053441-Prymnesium_polylepis.1
MKQTERHLRPGKAKNSETMKTWPKNRLARDPLGQGEANDLELRTNCWTYPERVRVAGVEPRPRHAIARSDAPNLSLLSSLPSPCRPLWRAQSRLNFGCLHWLNPAWAASQAHRVQ